MFNLSMLNYDYLDKLSNEELIRIYNELKEFDYEYANFVIDYIFDKNKDFIYKSVNKIISNYGLLSKYGFSKEENETDISQEGFIAFKESIDKFDLSKNILFTTFAYDQMSYKILDFISHDKIISSSEYFIKLQVKIKKISSELEFILQRNPTPEEIRDELISKTSYKHVSTNTIINALSTDLDASSDTNLINSKSSLLTGNDPNNNLLVSLEELTLCNLNDREYDILISLLGLKDDGVKYNRDYFSSKYNVSKNRIDQIYANAKKKVKRYFLNKGIKVL